MKPKHTIPALLIFLTVILSGCISTGAINATNVTEVQLAKANYKIIATNVRGEASAGYLLGASLTTFLHMKTLALVRVSGSGLLYEEAVSNLWDNFREEHGSPENRSLALVNIVYDAKALNLFIYTRPTVSVRADVIMFTEQ